MYGSPVYPATQQPSITRTRKTMRTRVCVYIYIIHIRIYIHIAANRKPVSCARARLSRPPQKRRGLSHRSCIVIRTFSSWLIASAASTLRDARVRAREVIKSASRALAESSVFEGVMEERGRAENWEIIYSGGVCVCERQRVLRFSFIFRAPRAVARRIVALFFFELLTGDFLDFSLLKRENRR